MPQPGRPHAPRTEVKQNVLFRLAPATRRQLAELARATKATRVSLVERAIENLHREHFPY